MSRMPALHSWLEDGYRLRPRRALAWPANGATGALWLSMTTSVSSDLHRERVATGHARGDSTTIPLPPALADSPAAPGSPRAPLPLASGAESAEAALGAVEGLDAMQRRLVFMRYLVRQRIYNEGFGAEEVPEQYRWSPEGDGHPRE